MQEHFQILIIGGGNAGLSVTSQLLRKKRPENRNHRTLRKHYYQPAWTLVGAGIYDINKTRRKEKIIFQTVPGLLIPLLNLFPLKTK
jgi:sulfide:quinone oxidoreductase